MTHGRFAPTPSGPLHRGSLLAAVASWLSARKKGGRWSVRIDNLDGNRCLPAAESLILRQLESFGLTWDGSPIRQSEHLTRYRAAHQRLAAQGRTYSCSCTRAALKQRQAVTGSFVYDRHCLVHLPNPGVMSASRFQLPDGVISWQDHALGLVTRASTLLGDPVVWRRDNVPGYDLACAVDEAAMGITEVVRGADLLRNTGTQIALLTSLDLALPAYAHVAIVLDANGNKLSKQNHAPTLSTSPAVMAEEMRTTLASLTYAVPDHDRPPPPADQLAWALSQPPRVWMPGHSDIDLGSPHGPLLASSLDALQQSGRAS